MHRHSPLVVVRLPGEGGTKGNRTLQSPLQGSSAIAKPTRKAGVQWVAVRLQDMHRVDDAYSMLIGR